MRKTKTTEFSFDILAFPLSILGSLIAIGVIYPYSSTKLSALVGLVVLAVSDKASFKLTFAGSRLSRRAIGIWAVLLGGFGIFAVVGIIRALIVVLT